MQPHCNILKTNVINKSGVRKYNRTHHKLKKLDFMANKSKFYRIKL